MGDEVLVVGAREHEDASVVVGLEAGDEVDQVAGERRVPEVHRRMVDRRPGDTGALADPDVLELVEGHQSSIGGSHWTPLMWLPPSAKIVLPVT